MAKEGELMQLLKGMKLEEEVKLPNSLYYNLMNATQYRARCKYGVFIEKISDCDFDKGYFKIKRVK